MTTSESAATRATLLIAGSTFVANSAISFWSPFLPLYLLELGAKDQADAVFWAAVASATNGIARLLTGPLWGMLADRYGRKLMYIRTLYAMMLSTLIMAAIQEPWQATIAWACQGLFSGFNPASIALTSVLVPDRQLNRSLGWLAGAQYLGSTIGPGIGALLAVALGYRGAMVTGALLVLVTATIALVVLPRDHINRQPGAPGRSVWGWAEIRATVTGQFALALFLFLLLFAMPQFIRLVAPVALRDIAGGGDVKGLVGLSFTISSLASVVGIILLAGRYFRPGHFRSRLALGCLVQSGAFLLLVAAHTETLFIVWFALISLLQAAMMPSINTLIASSVTPDKRGTAFGIASSFQALAIIIGPASAAAVTATSMSLGFILAALIMLSLAALIYGALREPRLRDSAIEIAQT